MAKRFVLVSFILSSLLFLAVIPASATERLCDTSFEDCRAPLLTLIKNENVEIDAAFWFLDDQQIYAALLKKFQSGVPVRILMDPRADEGHATNAQFIANLASAGFPMRNRHANGILHWKMMLFSGQGVVEFSGANFTQSEFLPYVPYVNYTDEAIYYSDDPAVVNSFRTKYDDWWTDMVNYQNYANINAPPQRLYATYSIDPELDFLPNTVNKAQDYGAKSMAAMAAEKVKLDIDMFRITNAPITNAAIAAFNRNLPIRLIVDSSEYRNPARPWDSYNVDRMFMAGIPLKITAHQGQNHEKALILYGQNLTIWGSSNWTFPSFNFQQEHDYFTHKPLFFQWFQNQFERRWNSDTEYKAFVPLPPGQAAFKSPASGVPQPTAVTLTWEGGPWGQLYDVYFGTSANPPLLAQNVTTGAPEDPSGPLTLETYKVSGLAPATKYYWKIVTKTMALLSANGPIWSFTTGTPATGSGPTVTGVSPATGASSGGNTVTITGTGFATGAIVSFGQSTATSAKVVSSSTITAVAPPHVGGVVGITVTNKAGDTGTLPNAYTFTSTTPSTAPKLNVIQPNTGSPSGGDSVVITGSNLVKGMTVTIGGAPATITNSSTVSINATTPSGNGAADVIVTNPNGQSAILRGAFNFANPPGPPSVTSASPSSGSINGGNTITVNGNGFVKGAVVSVGGIRCTTIIVLNSTTITATAPAHASGPADVVVTNMDGQSSTLSPGYNYVTAPPPSISSVVPNTGSVSGGTGITINGSDFVFGANVFVGSSPAAVQTTTASYIYATVPAASQPGTVDVVATNPDGQSSSPPGTFTYQ